jgi:outer membrane protein insertion porin family
VVVAIRVEGLERYSETQILAVIGQKVGEPLDLVAIDRGVKTLWTAFHVLASVYDQSVPGGVELRLVVTEMPSDREPRFTGNVDIDDETLLKWTLLEERAELFLHQAPRVRQRLLEGYRREGYYWAEVDIVTRGGEPADKAVLPDVIFEIREGPKVRVKEVEIRGNRSMPDRGFGLWKDGLTEYSKRQLEGPGLFNWRGSAFVQETLDADVLAMRQVYRDRGYLDAIVVVERLEFNAAKSRVRIHILIDEGPRYTVESLHITAVDWVEPENRKNSSVKPAEGGLHFPEAELLALLELKPGRAYEELLKNRDRSTLRDYYGKAGYLSHPSLPRASSWDCLEPELLRNVEKHTLQVTYRIVQGRKLTIREVLFAGSHHTRDKVLRREVSVFPGQQADLKEINRSLSRIQATGFFSNDFQPQDFNEPTYRFLPVPGQPDQVDLEYVVEEGRVVEFNITGGVDSNEGAFGIISLTMRNFDLTDTPSSFLGVFGEIYHKEAFHGGGQRLDLELAPGTRVSRFRVHFLEPDILNLHVMPVSLDLDLTKRLRIYDTHDEDRFEKRIKFGRRLDFDTSVALGLVHTNLDVSDLDSGGVPPTLVAQEALGDTELVGVTLDFARRSLDNYVNPKEGWNFRANDILYTKALGGDFEFNTVEGHWDRYHATGEKQDGTKPVLHVEVDGGVAQPFGDTDDVPYTERFFGGGAKNLRGFAFRGVGPNDPKSGFALGGQTYVSGTVEWLYPLYSIVQPGTYKPIEALRGVLFTDFGVFDPRSFTLQPDELRASVGFGIGLAHPFPLTLNFGFPVVQGDGDETELFSFSIGYNF